jgi:DNA-binding transcriptional LysR family regulator
MRQEDWESGVGRRLKLRHLRIFSEVVECGSMAKAAARLRLSQPTVSEVIAELEHTFGVRLLDRSPRGAEPTVYGDALLKRSIAAFDELKQSSRDIAFLADPTVGELRIGCTGSVAIVVLPPIVKRFSELYPRVVLHVEELLFAAQGDALRERRCDLILARVIDQPPLTAEEDLNVQVLFNDPVLVVADKRSRWARRRKLDLAELVNEPWVYGAPNSTIYNQLAGAFRARGLDLPKAALVTQSVSLRLHLLANGPYLTAFARSTLTPHAERYGLTALAVDLPYRPWPVVLATLKNRTLSPVVERFIECAREVARSMACKPGNDTRHRRKPNVS